MTKTFSFLFLFLFLASCGKGGGGGGGNSSNAGSLTDADITSSEVAPVEAQTFEINAKLTGFTRDQEDKIHQAFDLIKKVVASDEFKKKVLSKTYKGKKDYIDTNDSNATIYKKILQGSEKLNSGANNTMDLQLKAYRESANVIGYTKPSINTVYLNTRYLDKASFTTRHVAMNVTHEWLHKLGYKHAAKKTASRPHSVPYAVGYIMRSLAAKHD